MKRNIQGSVLAGTLIIISVVSILLTTSLRIVASNINYGINRESKEESLQIAEAGIYFYRWYLAHQVSGKTKKQVRNFWESGTAYGVSTPYQDDFNGMGAFSIVVDSPDPDSTIVTVESTGWTYKFPNMQRTVKVRFRQPSWSEYSVLCDADIRFGEGTEVYGPIHSNGGIRFDGLAHNVVSSSMSSYDDPDHNEWGLDKLEFGVHTHVNAPPATGITDSYRPNEVPPHAVDDRTDVFMVGREFPVTSKDFDSVLSDMADMKDEAGCSNVGTYCSSDSIVSSNGIYFNNSGQGRHIILQSDGNMRVSRVNNYNSTSNEITWESSASTFAIPDDGIIFVEENAWVEGQINNKKVTIVAADLSGGIKRNIFIKRDIRYTNYDGSDIIGLVAQNDVETTRDSEDDLRIDGALLAQSGRVGRTHYSNYFYTDHKSVITVNGSIATKNRYGFAYVDGTGYTTRNLIFDNNLLYYPPPYFPTGTDYSIDSWEEL